VKGKISSICVALFCIVIIIAINVRPGPVFAEDRVIKLNGGMEAKVTFVGRSNDTLTVSLILFNRGNNTFYLIRNHDNVPSAVDNSGHKYEFQTLDGIGHCIGGQQCNDLQRYTQVDPGSTITLNSTFGNHGGKGPVVSFSVALQYRIVSDQIQDGTLNDSQKIKQVRLMNISFPSIMVSE
jgi:hypothetical protein